MTWKILRTFFNILTANDKYYVLNRDILKQSIHMQISKKEKTFSEFISEFLKWRLNFEHFQTKMTFITDVFPEFRTPKNVVNQMSKNPPIIRPFDKQATCKGDQTLLISEPHHLYHIFRSLWRQLSWEQNSLTMQSLKNVS